MFEFNKKSIYIEQKMVKKISWNNLAINRQSLTEYKNIKNKLEISTQKLGI